jgi:hypothetical protein
MTDGALYPVPTRFDHAVFKPPSGQLFSHWASLQTPVPSGPKKQGQSSPWRSGAGTSVTGFSVAVPVSTAGLGSAATVTPSDIKKSAAATLDTVHLPVIGFLSCVMKKE